jgi:hypothetical protein
MTTGGRQGRRLRAVSTPAPTDPHPIEHLDDVVLSCRSDGHSFPYGDPQLDVWHKQRNGHGLVVAVSRSLMCPRCHTIVRDVIDRGARGMRQRQYIYPAGYSMPKGQGVTRREARAEHMGRIFARFDAEEAQLAGRPAMHAG